MNTTNRRAPDRHGVDDFVGQVAHVAQGAGIEGESGDAREASTAPAGGPRRLAAPPRARTPPWRAPDTGLSPTRGNVRRPMSSV
ncbi:MAG: hypothetical protein KDK91_17395, partial [Gammaproteobacteria bacterium]|nr:hypothetical protein [Gammaproteobacteria bacterium]